MRRYLLCFFATVSLLPAADENQGLFETKCAACHALPDPGSLNEKQWRAVLKTMQKRMREAGKPELTGQEFARIHCFLSAKPAASCPDTR